MEVGEIGSDSPRVDPAIPRAARDRPMGVPNRSAFWSNQWALLPTLSAK